MILWVCPEGWWAGRILLFYLLLPVFYSSQKMNKQKFYTILPALLFGGPGILMILIGLGIIPSGKGSIERPLWIMITTGVPFLSVGIYLLSKRVPRLSWFRDYVALLIITPFAVITNWAAFGPSPRNFETNILLPGNEISGRIVFGIAGLFFAVITIIGWYRTIRYWISGKKDWWYPSSRFKMRYFTDSFI